MPQVTEPQLIHSKLLLEVSKIVAKPGSSGQKIIHVLQLLAKWASFYYPRVLLPNYQTQVLEVAYSYGLPKANIDAGQYSVDFSQGLTGYVWRSGQVALVTDVLSVEGFLTRIAEPIQDSKHHVGFISVPIMVDGKPIGILSTQRRANPRRRYMDDVELLRVVATMIAPLLQLMQYRSQSVGFTPNYLDHDSGRWLEICESHNIIGSSHAFLSAVREVDKVKNSDAPIMLLGESGTGKELFAGMIHKESKRSKRPFICINCASIPENLLESELFGHEKGSFTGAVRRQQGKIEQAHEGTLFLDEIGDMPMGLQAKLLRVLQDKQIQPIGSDKPRKVDFRLITATHINLRKAVSEGRFRLDLFYRLNVIPISLPPLRERLEDIPLLAQYFLSHYGQVYDRRIGFTRGVHERLQAFSWPGNIRQLQNVIERAVLQAEDHWITVPQIEHVLNSETLQEQHDTPGEIGQASVEDQLARQQSKPLPVRDDKPPASPGAPAAEVFRPYAKVSENDLARILDTLKKTGGNQVQAARLLGYTPRQLRYRLKKLQSS